MNKFKNVNKYININKYKNIKTCVNNIKFASIKEAERYNILNLLERSGKISNLELQKKYILIPKQKGYRECAYYADFVYILNRTGKLIVEDVKGVKTEVYKIKKKLMKYIYNIDISEV